MTEWVFSVGIVLAAALLLAIIGFLSYKHGLDHIGFIGGTCLLLFLVILVLAVHGAVYGGGE